MRKPSVATKIALFFSLLVLASGSAVAGPCGIMTLAQLGSANCDIGNTHFVGYGAAYNAFIGASSGSGDWSYLDASRVTVTPFVNNTSSGFVITGIGAVSQNTVMDNYVYKMNEADVYFIATPLFGQMTGMSTSLTATLSGTGVYDRSVASEGAMAQSAYLLCGTNDPSAPCPSNKGFGIYTQIGGFPDGSDQTTYQVKPYPFGPSTGYGDLYMRDTIYGSDVTAYASLNTVTYTFNTVTPEPSSFVLFGSGLMGAIAAVRRRLQR